MFGFRSKMQGKLRCHVCDGDDCDKPFDEFPFVCDNALYCWKMTIREPDGSKRGSRGCIVDGQLMSMYCNKRLNSGNVSLINNHDGGRYHAECCQKHLCNDGALPTLPSSETDETDFRSTILVSLAVLLALIPIILVFAGYLYYRRRKNRQNRPKLPKSNAPVVNASLFESGAVQPGFSLLTPSSTRPPSTTITTVSYTHELLRATAAGDSTVREYLEGISISSGSGAGMPKLTQRTLAKHVRLNERLSGNNGSVSGSFDREVWLGVCYGENVAVKIYCTRNESLWARETEVYTNLLPSRHENILGYIGSDITSHSGCTQLWIVAQYHPLGSLRNYLKQLTKPLSHHQMFNLCLSAASGLLYLHTEIQGTQGKSSMAHRNLTSKSVIVKSDGSCVLADLAHIVTQDCLKNVDSYDIKLMAKRYLSPEMLALAYNPESLSDFQRADIYSLGLVYWEVCRMCLLHQESEPRYREPFTDLLINDDQEPTLEEMRKLVVDDQSRPHISDDWKSDATLAAMSKMIEECWHTSAVSRLPILRIKKNLIKLASTDSDVNLPLD